MTCVCRTETAEVAETATPSAARHEVIIAELFEADEEEEECPGAAAAGRRRRHWHRRRRHHRLL